MRHTIIASALVAIVFASVPASAASPEAAAVRVSYAGLDLSKPADLARLNRRIATSLETVCGSYAQARDGEEREISQCRAAALAQSKAAVAELTRTQVTRLAAR
jgi:UrcA family protein